MTHPATRIGLECYLDDPPATLKDARCGLLMNQASVDGEFRYACEAFAARFPSQLAALFSPQHGLWSEQQANMIESTHGLYPPLGLPVFSLYSETRRPTPEMLHGLDCLVIDLQDVGTRVYTFVWTVLECLRACAEAQVAVIVLDRPNPLGGEVVEGPMLDPAFQSFVGNAPIPLRHGLTLGELALLLNEEQHIGASVDVVKIQGWQRRMLFPDTGRIWSAPSPNMPRFETTLLYPGQVLLEGANLSEGRGTTLPFEMVGAPFLDPFTFVRALEQYEHPGLKLRPVRFQPTFDKWQGQSCGGAALHVVDPAAVRSVATTLAILAVARQLAPRDFAWLPPPYEYEYTKPPIDILFGSDRLRLRLADNSPVTPAEVAELIVFDETAWHTRTTPHRLYD